MRTEGESLPFKTFPEILFRSLDTGDVVRKIQLVGPRTSYEVKYCWMRFTADGRLLASRDDFMLCEIHEDGTVTHPFGPRRLAEVNSFELVGDDRLLIGTGAGSLHLLDLKSGKQLWTARHRRGCCGTLCVSADNRWLLTGGYDAGSARLWRLPN